MSAVGSVTRYPRRSPDDIIQGSANIKPISKLCYLGGSFNRDISEAPKNFPRSDQP